MRLTYTKILSRKILLSFLAFSIILAIAAFFVRSAISGKLERISKLAHSVELDQSAPQHALLLIHQAEDDFQESLLNPDTTKSRLYKVKLALAFKEIDSLLKAKPEITELSTADYNRVQVLYSQKLKLSAQLYTLKHSFDSLLKVYSGLNDVAMRNARLVTVKNRFKSSDALNSTDTIRKGGKKKGLLARIKDAIVNKDGLQGEVVEINHNKRAVDSATRKVFLRDKIIYDNKMRELQLHNIKLLGTQKDLISLNVHISNELENIINDEKTINFNLQNELNKIVFKSYHDTTLLLNNFYMTALFLVVIFAILLIVFIVKLDKSETTLLEENKRAVAIAQQKMDLLLHMSHEIRNPLTGIHGFLHILSRTPLTPKQTEMLGSIRLSSDMLLRTLNDTLDAAKMESSEFKIHSDPFNPDLELREVLESMEFSAAKKKLSLDYRFEGDKDAVLSGDAFRLKQVMVNLLSNAIKYTKTGGITVVAQLAKTNGQSRLQVDITDTGDGITPEQQVNLFSKYYQTNSAKGNIGTGLGLYICKELIQMQKGAISVQSQPGKGSTFSFYIPYEEKSGHSDDREAKVPVIPLTTLSGIRILAVDDNEVNLMSLKMMTAKWNIKFYNALDGTEALDLLKKEDITVVLADVNTVDDRGSEFVTALKKQKSPLNKIPVIGITADAANPDEKKNSGYAELLSKPVSEGALAQAIIKTIKA